MQKITYPTKTLAQGFEYTCAAATDIKSTWRKFGWTPKAELSQEEPAKEPSKQAKTSKEVSHA
jgi:hypothetical protein